MSQSLIKRVYCFLLRRSKEERPGSYRQIGLILILCKVTKHFIQELISKAWQLKN